MAISRSQMGKQLTGNRMPLTSKGKKIMRSMKEQYGPDRGEQVFYASRNKGRISGVERARGGGFVSSGTDAGDLEIIRNARNIDDGTGGRVSKMKKGGKTKSKGNKICPEGKAWAKRTFDKYPSAYANLAASKYCKDPNYAKKAKGGKRKGK